MKIKVKFKNPFKGFGKALGMDGGKTPDIVSRDPVKEKEEADRAANNAANAALADKKKRRKESSLLSTGGAQGSKDTLGS